jgi:hypothetical protein
MGDLLLSYIDPETVPLASGEVYAVLFRQSDNKALDMAAVTPDLQTFDGNHTRFGTLVSGHPVRTRYFQKLMAEGTFTLPDSDADDFYHVEYWKRNGGTRVRSADRLLNVEYFNWVSGKKVESRLSSALETKITSISQRYRAQVSLSYDQTTKRIGIMAWLDKDEALQVDAVSAVVTMTDSTGAVIFTKALANLIGDGSFTDEHVGTELAPDETYFVVCTIVDAAAVPHTSASSPVTWD